MHLFICMKSYKFILNNFKIPFLNQLGIRILFTLNFPFISSLDSPWEAAMHPPWYIYLPAIMTVSEGKISILDRKLEIRFYTKGGKEKNLVFVISIL